MTQYEYDLRAVAMGGQVSLVIVSADGDAEESLCLLTMGPQRARRLARTLRRFAEVAAEQARDEAERN